MRGDSSKKFKHLYYSDQGGTDDKASYIWDLLEILSSHNGYKEI
jgi:hypothetical protein